LRGELFGPAEAGERVAALSEVRLLAPVAPGKIIGIGLNYAAHAREMNRPLPASPVVFLKPPSAIIGPDEPIVYPPRGLSNEVHHEAELAVVIGRRARNVSVADAPGYVFGYTCANDVTARDVARAQQHNTLSKAFDTFLPLGPAIVTGLDTSNLAVMARVNGKTRQSSRTNDLVFSVPQLVSFLSEAMTLLPGDVIITGTPSGVGPLVPGDVVEVEVEGIGVLRNPVV
jgi:2-keto-4-pentenoate hydratase/2-oxohepta-3-ene-1,7-dioic acid hydratase in catechol pathway